MDYYPAEYLQHPLPCLVLTGLSSESETTSNVSASSIQHPLEGVSTTQTIQTLSKRIKEILGTDLPVSVWEPGLGSGSQNVLTGRANPNSLVTGVSTLTAGSERLFSTIVAEKGFTFPTQRKKSSIELASNHSTLSPLNPVSPLYPDGLFTPLWFNRLGQGDRPGALLAFHSLWQPREGDNKQVSQILQSSATSQPAYREKDILLANQLNEMRKSSVDKQIKYAVVFWNLNSPEGDEITDDRLTQIRRSSGLDTRSSFFVLDRRAANNIEEFLTSVQRALFEPSFQGYREHYRRIKRKLARVSAINPRSLSSQTWVLRYEFKLAYFSLIRQDLELALRHFEVAYCALSDILIGGMVDANTPRWNEAILIIDSINFQLCRLHFYSDNAQFSLIQLNCHLLGFKRLYTALKDAIPDPSYNYESWKARQYRLFADVLDWAIRSGKDADFRSKTVRRNTFNLFQLGSHIAWQAQSTDSKRPSLLTPATLVSLTSSTTDSAAGTYPISFLQHPGYYYYESACRLIRASNIAKKEENSNLNLDSTQSIIEALSKSYEHFKRYRGDRMTLKVASSIAASYLSSKKYDLAMKFYDRIAKAYRKEPWPQLLSAALQQALFCARQLELSETVIRHSLELLSPVFTIKEKIRKDIVGTFLKTITRNSNSLPKTEGQDDPLPPSPRVLEIEQDIDTSFLKVAASFKTPQCYVDDQASFQIRILGLIPKYRDITMKASFVRVGFSDSNMDVLFKDADFAPTDSKLNEGTQQSFTSNLSITHNLPIYLQAYIVPQNIVDIKITSITVGFCSIFWEVVLPFDLSVDLNEELGSGGSSSNRFHWNASSESESTEKESVASIKECLTLRVLRPVPKLKMKMNHLSPAYVGEAYPVSMKLFSKESQRIKADVLSVWGNSVNGDTIHFGSPECDPISLDEVFFSQWIDPGVETPISLFFKFGQAPGLRSLIFKARYSLPNLSSDIVLETQEEIVISVDLPFDCGFQCFPISGISSRQASGLLEGTSDLLYNLTPSQSLSKSFMLVSSIKPNGVLNIKDVSLTWQNGKYSSDKPTPINVFCPSDTSGDSEKWECGVVRLENYIIEVTLPIPDINSSLLSSKPAPVPLAQWDLDLGELNIDWHRAENTQLSSFNTIIPPIKIPSFRIAVELEYPAMMREGESFTLLYTVVNATARSEEVIIRLDASDSPIVYAGWKVTHRRLLPCAILKLNVTCHALTHGRIVAPRLILERPVSEEKEVLPLTGIVYGWQCDAPSLLIQPSPSFDISNRFDERVAA